MALSKAEFGLNIQSGLFGNKVMQYPDLHDFGR